MAQKLLLTISCFGLLFGLSGCGGGPSDMPDLGEVSGVVKVDGKPAANVLVTFQPEEGRPSSAKTNESGEYVLRYTAEEDGAVLGKHLVSITTISTDTSEEGGGCGGCGCGEDGPLEPIHPKYNTDARNNPKMTVEVKPGSQEFDFDVETDLEARKAATQSGGGGRSPCYCE